MSLRQSRWSAQAIAGAIVPAIAATNAIVASLQVRMKRERGGKKREREEELVFLQKFSFRVESPIYFTMEDRGGPCLFFSIPHADTSMNALQNIYVYNRETERERCMDM